MELLADAVKRTRSHGRRPVITLNRQEKEPNTITPNATTNTLQQTQLLNTTQLVGTSTNINANATTQYSSSVVGGSLFEQAFRQISSIDPARLRNMEQVRTTL